MTGSISPHRFVEEIKGREDSIIQHEWRGCVKFNNRVIKVVVTYAKANNFIKLTSDQNQAFELVFSEKTITHYKINVLSVDENIQRAIQALFTPCVLQKNESGSMVNIFFIHKPVSQNINEHSVLLSDELDFNVRLHHVVQNGNPLIYQVGNTGLTFNKIPFAFRFFEGEDEMNVKLKEEKNERERQRQEKKSAKLTEEESSCSLQ